MSHDTPRGFGMPLARYLRVAEKTTQEASRLGASEVLVVSQGDSTVVDELPAIFDVLLRDSVAYRFVNGQDTALFPPSNAVALLAPDPGDAAVWYARRPTQELDAGYRLVALDGSWPQEPLQAVDTPRTFENGIEIQAYDWYIEDTSQDGDSPGEQQARFWLLWQVLWLSPQDTHFFVQLLDSGWSPWGQQDSAGYPTGYRRKGDRIISGFHITQHANRAGSPLWARAGLYLYPQIVNLAVINDTGDFVGDAVIVGPLQAGP
jgi:hypothetical protein